MTDLQHQLLDGPGLEVFIKPDLKIQENQNIKIHPRKSLNIAPVLPRISFHRIGAE